jgi:hypothetical protein
MVGMGRRWTAAAVATACGIGVALVPPGPAGAAPTPGAPMFEARGLVPIPGILHVAVGDLNHDDRPDLVATTGAGGDSHLRVALAAGTPGTFAAASDLIYSDSGNAQRPVIADVDDDDDPDIVVAAGADGYVWALGNGDGTFGAVQSSNAITTELAFGDFAGTSDIDMAAIGASGSVVIRTGDGTGTFTDSGISLAVNGLAKDLAVGDVDDDGRDDLVVVAWAGNPLDFNMPSTITTFHSSEVGTFDPPEEHTVINVVSGVAIGDLDGVDGLDIVATAAKAGSDGVLVLLGHGDGTFGAPVRTRSGGSPSNVALGDLDGDQNLDVVTDEQGIFINFGNGDGTLAPAVGYRGGFTPTEPVLADLDGDDDLDIANVGSANTPAPAGVDLLTNAGDGTFTGTPMAKWAGSDKIAVGDVNGDGRDDYVQALLRSGSQAEVFLNDGEGRLQPYQSIALPSVPSSLSVGRLGTDADGDLVAMTTAGVSVAKSNGDGTFAAAVSYPAGTAAATPPPPVIADLDGDTHADVVVGDNAGGVRVLLGDAGGELDAATTFAAGGIVTDMVTTDLDGNGDPDLITASAASTNVSVLLGDGDGGFAPPISYALPASPQFVAAGNFDGDGTPDIAVSAGTGSSSKVYPFAGVGDGTLVARPPTGLVNSPTSGAATARALAVADFTGDGLDDLALDGARFAVSTCVGSFTNAESAYEQYDAPGRAFASDMDGDGLPDLVGRTGNGNATVRLGVAPATPPVSPAAPFANCPKLVDRLYQDLLQRPPTATERSADAAAMAAGTLTKGALVARIRASSQHTTNVDPVARLYRAYFLRSPDPSGLDYWVNKRRAGWTLLRISNHFAHSSEFLTKYGSLGNAQFVDLVYQNVLGRPGDPGGRAFWIGRLDSGRASRGQVMLNFSDSSEYRTKQAAEVDTGVLYAWLLRRRPTSAELDAAVAALETGGGTVGELATQLIDRAEYAARVGAP